MRYKLIMVLFVLSCFSCEKWFPCKSSVLIENKSSKDILIAMKSLGVDQNNNRKCQLRDIVTLPKGSIYDYFVIHCMSRRGFLGPIDIYVIDPSKINDTTLGKLYDCDSINYYNQVLKKYSFDKKEDFKKINYKIVYE